MVDTAVVIRPVELRDRVQPFHGGLASDDGGRLFGCTGQP